MTDLDQFAAAALKGLLANPNFDELDDTDLATRAYEIASAMTEKRDHWNGIVAPTLTDEERAALTLAWMNLSETARRGLQKGHSEEECEPLRAASHTIRKLLERLS
jgi:hypothetical protein